MGNFCLVDSVCLYLEPLKNYKASKLTMLKNTQKCNIFFLIMDAHVGSIHAIHF